MNRSRIQKLDRAAWHKSDSTQCLYVADLGLAAPRPTTNNPVLTERRRVREMIADAGLACATGCCLRGDVEKSASSIDL